MLALLDDFCCIKLLATLSRENHRGLTNNNNMQGSGNVRIATGSLWHTSAPNPGIGVKEGEGAKLAHAAGTLTLAGGDSYGENLKANVKALLNIASSPWEIVTPQQKNSVVINALRLLQMYTSNKKCVE